MKKQKEPQIVSKKTKYLKLFILIILISGGFMFNFYRKEIPYGFEIVSLDSAVGLINTTKWNKRDLVISYKNGSGMKKKVIIEGKNNEIIISGLENGKKCKLSISRDDFIGKLKYKSKTVYAVPKEGGSKYIVLVGASVGRHWDFPELYERLGNDKYSFGYRGKGSFDKEAVVLDLLNSEIKPDAIIIKECAAYFPRDLKESKRKIAEWVSMIAAENITPIVATCAPVTRQNDEKYVNRQSGILEYNKFIRAYAKDNNLSILDLEKALGNESDDSCYLRQEYAKGDGLHLNKQAYRTALDPIVLPTLEEALK